MSNLKRILCVVLVLVFAAGLISCNNEPPKPSNTDTPDTTPKEDNPFADLNYEGASFVIQTSVNVDTASYNSSNYLIQGSDEAEADKAANSAIERNKKVESDLNIKLTFFDSD